MDKQRTLEDLWRRQALRREARLPLLDIPTEYHRAVAAARWAEIVEEHYERAEAEILANMRATHGPAWGYSAGGQMAVRLMVEKALRERFEQVPGR